MSIFDAEKAALARCDPNALLQLVRAGDSRALEQLTRCYGERLLAVGRKQCRDEDRARDAVQDAYVAAAGHLDDYRGEGSLEGWLVRIVTNACRRMQRGRKHDASLHVPVTEQSAGAGDPEDEAAQSRLGRSLADALASLAPVDRAIVLLSEVNGWTGPEIAEAMGLTPGQVRTRLSRSRRGLRSQLAETWGDWSGDEKNPADE